MLTISLQEYETKKGRKLLRQERRNFCFVSTIAKHPVNNYYINDDGS